MKKPAKRGTGGPAKPPPDDPEQSRRFEVVAQELGADETGKLFERALDALTPPTPDPQKRVTKVPHRR